MPENGIYCDSTVFKIAVNPKHPDHCYCRSLLTGTGLRGRMLAYSAISRAETELDQWLKILTVTLVGNGVPVKEVTADETKASMKSMLPVKKSLEQLNVGSKDIRHIASVVSAKVPLMVVRDQDFIDPSNKSSKGMKSPRDRVKRLLRKELGISVCLPDEVCVALGLPCCSST